MAEEYSPGDLLKQLESCNPQWGEAIRAVQYRKQPLMPLTQLFLLVSQACNMRCKYCYAGGGSYGNRPQFMSKEVAEAAVEFLLRESGEEKIVSIVFFGGEPLLNFELVRHVVVYARQQAVKFEKKVNFTLVTNGVLLDPRLAQFLKRENIAVTVSIDGPAEIHDLVRVFPDGSGTYEKVYAGWSALLEANSDEMLSLSIEAVLTHLNADLLESIFYHLLNLGAHEVFLSPIVMTDGEARANLALTPEDLERIAEAENRLLQKYVQTIIKEGYAPYVIHAFLTPLVRLALSLPASYKCSAGHGRLAIAADGSIYPCQLYVGEESQRWGNVFEGIDRERQERFLANIYVDERSECSTCWARYICGGECYARSLRTEDHPRQISGELCALNRRRAELSIKAYLKLCKKDKRLLSLSKLIPPTIQAILLRQRAKAANR